MKHVLFLCTGNSCRSIMAEGLLAHYGRGRVVAHSAGSAPTGEVHPHSLAMLARHGMNAKGYHSKSWDALEGTPIDIVITVCDNAAGESCPLFLSGKLKAHWGVPDPAHAGEAAFERVFAILEQRVKALVALDDITPKALQEIGAL